MVGAGREGRTDQQHDAASGSEQGLSGGVDRLGPVLALKASGWCGPGSDRPEQQAYGGGRTTGEEEDFDKRPGPQPLDVPRNQLREHDYRPWCTGVRGNPPMDLV